jgi:hypothetical protein
VFSENNKKMFKKIDFFYFLHKSDLNRIWKIYYFSDFYVKSNIFTGDGLYLWIKNTQHRVNLKFWKINTKLNQIDFLLNQSGTKVNIYMKFKKYILLTEFLACIVCYYISCMQ